MDPPCDWRPISPSVAGVVRFLLAVWKGSEDFWKSGNFRLRDLGELDEKNLEIWKTWAARPVFL